MNTILVTLWFLVILHPDEHGVNFVIPNTFQTEAACLGVVKANPPPNGVGIGCVSIVLPAKVL